MSFATYTISFQLKLWKYLAFKEFDKAKSLIESLIENGNAKKMKVSKDPYEVYKAYFVVSDIKKPEDYDYYFVYERGELIDYCTSTSERSKGYLKNKGYISMVPDE